MVFDIEEALGKLTTPEKLSLLAGKDFWHTANIDRLGIPSIRLSDGPNGVRGTKFFNSVPAACFPCGTGLAATWDVELLEQVGTLLGLEAKAKAAHVLLGPTVNIQRSPLGGRGFESFSEDPLLNGKIAAAYIRGVQSQGTIATIKHLVANDQETDRFAMSSNMTERTLREVYLLPFQIALREAGPRALMTAYNKVNGLHASENPHLLQDILRKEWGFTGLVMSDWRGTYSVSEAIIAGLDLEMPGPPSWRTGILEHALNNRKVLPHQIDDRVRGVLGAVKWATENSGIKPDAPELGRNTPQDRALVRKAAADSIVLLKNDNKVLPWKKSEIKKLAIIGPNAKVANTHGGGSAAVRSYYKVSPFEGLKSALMGVEILYAPGVAATRNAPSNADHLRNAAGEPGFDFTFYNHGSDQVVHKMSLTDTFIYFAHSKPPGLNKDFRAVASATFTPEKSGIYEFGVEVIGKAKLYVKDTLVVDNWTHQTWGTSFTNNGSIEELGQIDLKEGVTYNFRIEFETGPDFGEDYVPHNAPLVEEGGGLRFGGGLKIDPEGGIAEAVKLASEVDHVVIFAGLNGDWESEGFDRPDMSLPGLTDKLISSIMNVNPSTVLVLQCGTPVELPFISQTPTILQAWYGGQELGNAITDVLFGDVTPSGKLSLSWPKRVRDNPAYLNFGRSDKGTVTYGEGVYAGWKWYEALQIEPEFPFGHGLSYTSFEYSSITLDKKRIGKDDKLTATVKVKNIGSVAGAEAVQFYVADTQSYLKRPVKELKGFNKLHLKPGETKVVSFVVDKYAISYFDEDRSSWLAEKGTFTILVGASSADIKATADFELSTTYWWTGL